MFAKVNSLRYWKSERADITTCEDALRSSVRHGLFCVADGAGTTLFSNIWADILVEQYVQDPLMTADPFEMDWWIRQAQKRYHDLAPKSDTLKWNARQKALEQGAYATLATLCFTRSDRQSATAGLLVVGDSCVIIGYAQEQRIAPFPLQHAEDFDRAPYCVPSLLKNLNRHMLYAKTQEVTLSPGDIVILATDAVARWIISGGGTSDERAGWNAFLEVAQKTEGDWPTFINTCRANQSIVDDDSTAIVIRLQENGDEDERLGVPGTPRPELLAMRTTAFEQARIANNKELIAIVYGNGHMLNAAGISLPENEKVQARKVADALRDMLQIMRDAANTTNFAARVEPAWWQHADLLMDEPCAENIRKSLEQQGVHLKRPANALPVTFGDSSLQGNRQILPSTTLKDSTTPSGQSVDTTQRLGGTEPEMTRIFTPVLTATTTIQEEMADIQAFRKALATHDPLTIIKAYHPSLNSNLTSEEQLRLQEAQSLLKDELLHCLDRDDDESTISVAHAIETAPIHITLPDFVKQRILQVRERQAAFDRLLNVLEEGTARQKVEAYTLSQKHNALNAAEREQIEMAQRLTDALHAQNIEMISSAYDDIEFSPSRKHFIFTQEEQQIIKQARQEQATVVQFRMMLESGNATTALLTQCFQKFHSPATYLSQEEMYIADTALQFLNLYRYGKQAKLEKNNERLIQLVRLYDALYYSPYHLAFTASEVQQIERIRSSVSTFPPSIMVVNGVQVNITQFVALYEIKPHYVRSHLLSLHKSLATQAPGIERQQTENEIAYWSQEIEPRRFSLTVLHDLINQVLLEQKMNMEISHDKTKRSLEKDVQKRLDELSKVVRDFIGKDQQNIREILKPYALYDVFDLFFQATGSGQTLSNWLQEQRKTASVYYSERPELMTATTEWQRCWLFTWWFIRHNNKAAGE